MSMRKMPVVGIVLALSILGCRNSDGDESFAGVGGRPEELPIMLNKDLPFRYPPSLYARKVQANVTLRLYVDKEGQVVSESTHVAETSTYAPLDSAAVRGSRDLRFIPAKTRGVAVPVSILFPVYFRHPEAAPLPGDTVLKGTTPTTAQPDTVKSTSVTPVSSKAGESAATTSGRAKSAPTKGTTKKR